MATEVVGRAPKKLIRVAICPGKDPVQVPMDQMTYLCPETGQTIATMLFDSVYHAASAAILVHDKQMDNDDIMQSSYAPQLHFSREDDES